MATAKMSRSAALGSSVPFQTAAGFTRSLVEKASDTWLAISDNRGAITLPKPSALASGVSTVASRHSFRRRSSSSSLMMPSRAFTVAMPALGSATTSFMPLL